MRHGWKTRIDERKYFENKRYEREERLHIISLMQRKLDQELAIAVAKLEKDKEIH